MNPTLPASPEQQPAPNSKPELLTVPDAQSAPAGANQPTAGVPAAPSLPSVQSATPVKDESKNDPPPITGPALAADQDVIEAEWVEKAEEVVKKTAGDPHAEEDAVEDLQVDYLKKRYNKDVKKSKDG